MDISQTLGRVGCTGAVCAAPIAGGPAVERSADDLMTPASVMKIQVALATLDAIVTGRLAGTRRVLLAADSRTPGPVGVSLMADDVELSVRDLATRVSCQVPFQHIPAPVSRCSNDQISCMPTQIAVKITLG